MKSAQKQLVILLSLAVLFPSGVSFAHVFSAHQHKVCPDHGDGHFHQKNLDCEYFQFRHNQNFLSENKPVVLFVAPNISEKPLLQYFFLPKQNPSPFFLRGPPVS